MNVLTFNHVVFFGEVVPFKLGPGYQLYTTRKSMYQLLSDMPMQLSEMG